MRSRFSLFLVAVVVALPHLGGAQRTDRMALAYKLLDAMRFDERLIASPLLGSVSAGPAPATPEKASSAVEQFYKKYLKEGELRRIAASAYAARFSEAEITELIAFNLSPVGRKMISLQPAIGAEVRDGLAKLIDPHREELRAAISADMRRARP